MMKRLQSFLGLFAMMLFMAAAFVNPANASAMLSCGAADIVHEADAHTDHHGHEHASEMAAKAKPKAEHCASHACLLALPGMPALSLISFDLRPLALLPSASPSPQNWEPQGLRKPPRF